MHWSYKTVLYELKKEGLLGSAFLDESEIELSLNEFGATGWELVAMLETRDGIIAVFKQPLGQAPVESVRSVIAEEQENVVSRQPLIHERPASDAGPVKAAIAEPEEDPEPDTGIGSIRIE